MCAGRTSQRVLVPGGIVGRAYWCTQALVHPTATLSILSPAGPMRGGLAGSSLGTPCILSGGWQRLAASPPLPVGCGCLPACGPVSSSSWPSQGALGGLGWRCLTGRHVEPHFSTSHARCGGYVVAGWRTKCRHAGGCFFSCPSCGTVARARGFCARICVSRGV